MAIRRSGSRVCPRRTSWRGRVSWQRKGSADEHSGVCRSRSRTISTSPACRPPRRVRATLIFRPKARPASRACWMKARFWSARRIWISLRRAWSACAARTASPRNVFDPTPGAWRIVIRLRRRGCRRDRVLRARHGHGRIGPRASGVRQYRRIEADQRQHLRPRRGAGLPLDRDRLNLRRQCGSGTRRRAGDCRLRR